MFGDIHETMWRWRCRVLRDNGEKTLADYPVVQDRHSEVLMDEEDDSSNPDGKPAPNSVKPAKPVNKKKSPSSKTTEPGSALVVKTLYQTADSWEDNMRWQDYPPHQMSKRAAKAQERVAIRVFKAKDTSKPVVGGVYALKYHKIDIQNRQLVEALAPILKETVDYHVDPEENAEFEEPFMPLYFCYDGIAAKLRGTSGEEDHKNNNDNKLRPYLQLLVGLLDDVFAPVRSKRRRLTALPPPDVHISFDLAWTFFPRHCAVRSLGNNCELLSRVVDTRYCTSGMGETKSLVITTEFLRFDGEAYVWETQQLSLDAFSGTKPAIDLPHCPLHLLPDADAVATRLQRRGQHALRYQGLVYCQYQGIGLRVTKDETTGRAKTERHNVDGRILVDVVGYKKHHLASGAREGKDSISAKKIVPGTGRVATAEATAAADAAAESKYNAEKEQREMFDPYLAEMHMTMSKLRRQRRAEIEIEDNQNNENDNNEALAINPPGVVRLTDEEQAHNRHVMMKNPDILMYMFPLVEAYALKNKDWMQLFVEDIRDIEWNNNAYDHLVYDEQQKDLVLSFVESHDHTNKGMDDVIIGKGDGLIVLLSGPPGTGKTLMAEAVADRTRRPLFYLQAEDLGTNAAVLGANLKSVFQMATDWDAVILLDEADVFMAERHPQDIARNELVSIFLREIEYYRGIIFLTTNLYDTIDSAFRSRVSLHLLFRPLAAEARLLVWRKFLARAEEDSSKDKNKNDNNNKQDIAEEDLQELSAWSLNGREIKTAVKMAVSWCAHKNHTLTLDRLENSIRVTSPHASKSTPAGEVDALYE